MAVSTIATIPALKDVYTQLKTRMDKAVEDFRTNMAAARTGRASIQMLDTVRVPYYGSEMPINQVANLHVPEPQLITVQPFDPSIMAEIEKAITEERRRDMVKHLKQILEDHRTAVRNIRRDGNDAIKKTLKDKKISEDDEKKALDEVQKLTDVEIKKMEEMCASKEKELMTI